MKSQYPPVSVQFPNLPINILARFPCKAIVRHQNYQQKMIPLRLNFFTISSFLTSLLILTLCSWLFHRITPTSLNACSRKVVLKWNTETHLIYQQNHYFSSQTNTSAINQHFHKKMCLWNTHFNISLCTILGPYDPEVIPFRCDTYMKLKINSFVLPLAFLESAF